MAGDPRAETVRRMLTGFFVWARGAGWPLLRPDDLTIRFTRLTPGARTSWVIWPRTIWFFEAFYPIPNSRGSLQHVCHEATHCLQIERAGGALAWAWHYLWNRPAAEREAENTALAYLRMLKR